MENINKKNLNLYCEKCDFQAIRPAEWLRHIETKKHLRNGQKISSNCEFCNKSFISPFSLKIHTLTFHSTVDERRGYKYYCSVCDLVFISQLYMKKHLNGKIHKNLEKAINSIKTININKVNNLNNDI